MVATVKPAIHIIPGSFSLPSHYDELKSYLVARGFETVVSPLLSSGRRDPKPPATMEDDAAHIRSVTEALVGEGKEVVLLMHSYGGVPGSESAKGLLKKDREAAGKEGGIVRLIYLAALVLPVGASMGSVMGDTMSDFVHVDGEYMYHDAVGTTEVTFSDMPFEDGLRLAKSMTHHSIVSFAGELSYPAYNDAPVSYIFCAHDRVIVPEFQKSMIAHIETESGRKVDVLTSESGHCPTASQPQQLAALVSKAVNVE